MMTLYPSGSPCPKEALYVGAIYAYGDLDLLLDRDDFEGIINVPERFTMSVIDWQEIYNGKIVSVHSDGFKTELNFPQLTTIQVQVAGISQECFMIVRTDYDICTRGKKVHKIPYTYGYVVLGNDLGSLRSATSRVQKGCYCHF